MTILFFNPFGYQSGAEYMLEDLAAALHQRGHNVMMYSRRHRTAPTRLRPVIATSTPPVQRSRIGRRLAACAPELTNWSVDLHLRNLNRKLRPQLWYLNTMHMPEIAALAARLRVPYAVHFHDLEWMYQDISASDMQTMIGNAALTVGCSTRVCENLQCMGSRAVELFYETIDVSRVTSTPQRREQLRRELGISPDTFVWLASGTVDYRKGADLFPRIAERFGAAPVAFLWLGGGRESGYRFYVEKLIAAKAARNCRILGYKSDDYYEYLGCADGLLLPSREDPFPLVMIEAAALGKPIVSFNSGGVAEFVKDGVGVVVDSWDLETLCAAMRRVMNGETGVDAARAIATAQEFDVQRRVSDWEAMVGRRIPSAINARPAQPGS